MAEAENGAAEAWKPRLKTVYDEKIREAMQEEFKYKNPMQIPRLDKIVLNMGVGEGGAGQQKGPLGARRFDVDRRPAASDDARQELDRGF